MKKSRLNLSLLHTTLNISLISLFVFTYHLLFFDKYVPVQDGWFNVFAEMINRGELPYRDFNVFIQPLYLLLTAGLTKFFGNTLLVLREYGLAERIVLAIILYLLYSKISTKTFALIASLTSLIFYTGFNADVIYSYYQTTTLFILIAIYFLMLFADTQHETKSGGYYYLTVSGFFFGLAFLTKQSTGAVVPLAFLIGIIIYQIKMKKPLMPALFCYAAGISVPILLCLHWLFTHHLIELYLANVFKSAASSKGGVQLFYNGFILGFKPILKALPFALLITIIFHKQKTADQPNFYTSQNISILAIFITACTLLFIATDQYLSLAAIVRFFQIKESFLVFVVLDISIIFSCIYLYIIFKTEQS